MVQFPINETSDTPISQLRLPAMIEITSERKVLVPSTIPSSIGTALSLIYHSKLS